VDEAPAGTAAAKHTPPSPAMAARVLIAVFAGLLLLVALTLVVVSFASYATVKHRLDRYASDHDANFSRHRFDAVVWQLRVLAVVLAAAGGVVGVRRRRLAELAEAIYRSAALDIGLAARAGRRALVTDPLLHLGALGAIFLLGVLVRLEFLFQPMRYDESGTYVHYASEPLYVGLTTYTAPNNHLLNTALVHVSTVVFGNHPWAIRLPAFMAGILLVPATYLAARIVYGRNAALVAAALVATSSVLIEYSTNARGYMGIALVFILMMALATYLCKSASQAAWTAFAILAALGFFTIPTMVYAFGAVMVWLAVSISAEGRRELLRARYVPATIAAAVLTLLLYAPVIATSGTSALIGNSFVKSRSWSYFAHHLPSSLGTTFARWHRDQPPAVWIALTIAFIIGLVLHRRLGLVKLPPAAGPLLFVPLLLLLQHVVPYERVWSFLLPIYLMTAAAGLVFVTRRLAAWRHYSAGVALLAVALCASLAGEAVASRGVARSEDTSTFRDAPKAAAFLEGYLRPGDRILVSPPADLILEYYLDADGLDAGRLLYTDFKAARLIAVVKEGPGEYPLPEVLRQHLQPGAARRLRPVLLRRYPHTLIYELVPRGT
jgi:hypothetical protein